MSLMAGSKWFNRPAILMTGPWTAGLYPRQAKVVHAGLADKDRGHEFLTGWAH